jgi:predicted DNA-binding transcriptional regulator AlpA
MLQATRNAVRSMIQADPTLTPAEISAVEKAIQPGDAGAPAPDRRVLRCAQVAALLSCSKRTVLNLASIGAIRRVYLPNRKRSLGYSLESIEAFIQRSTETERAE